MFTLNKEKKRQNNEEIDWHIVEVPLGTAQQQQDIIPAAVGGGWENCPPPVWKVCKGPSSKSFWWIRVASTGWLEEPEVLGMQGFCSLGYVWGEKQLEGIEQRKSSSSPPLLRLKIWMWWKVQQAWRSCCAISLVNSFQWYLLWGKGNNFRRNTSILIF